MRFAILALVVHAVVIVATSIPWLRETFMGSATAGMTEEQKLDAAVREATSTISAIAKEHGVSPQELGARFGGNGKAPPPSSKQPTEAAPAAQPATTPAPAAPEPPAGPAAAPEAPAGTPAPAVPPGPSLPAVDDNVDLFK
jgi:hypothetical protein